jgi:nucleotide-binding universal stress UspA family protein
MKHYGIRTILVPIDFSPLSLNALRHAEELAKLTKARIVVLHVVEPYIESIGIDTSMVAVGTALEQDMANSANLRLQEIARATSKRSHCRVTAMVLFGRTASMITKTAANVRASLIIMGTHGANGFVDKLLGSNTYRVATLSRTPVMSVHKKPSRAGYRHLIYPVRDRPRAAAKFALTLAFAKLFHSTVHVLGVFQSEQQAEQTRVRTLCSVVRKQFARRGVKVKTASLESRPLVEATVQYAKEHAGSLVVIVQDSDFRLVELFQLGFAKRVLHQVLTPVLTIPHRP